MKSLIRLSIMMLPVLLCSRAFSLSLDNLLEEPKKSPVPSSSPQDNVTAPSSSKSPAKKLSLESMMGDKQDADSASLSLDNIYQGRELHRLKESKGQLARLNRQLSHDCSCSLRSNACYDLTANALGLTQQNVISAAQQADTILTKQSKTICQSWNNSKEFTSNDPAAINKQLEVTKRYADLLGEVNKASQSMANKLRNQNRQIEEQIAQQQDSSGFDWGKAMAMGVGAIAGGLGHLDMESQSKIITGIIQDGYSGDSSMSNLQATVNNLNAQMKQASSNTDSTSNSASSGKKTFKYDYIYTDSCPAPSKTKIHSPIKANSQACVNAMKRYAKAATCNLIDELDSAQEAYSSACASEIY